jgi:predicted dienelactone hydrolase
MSHGSGGNAVQMGWIASEMARRGMIVIAPNHQGTTSRDSDPFETVKVWKRANDLKAVLDFIAKTPPLGLQPDMERVASFGFSLGGFSALSVAGIQVSKAQFIDYCAKNAGILDCGWMQKAGVDFSAIDQTLYEQSNRDPRISVTVAVDPALPLAMTSASLQSQTLPTLIINLGEPNTIPVGMRLNEVVKTMPGATYRIVPQTHHFTFVAECSTLGEIVIGLAGDDNICSDEGFRPRAKVHPELVKLIGDFLAEQLKAGI